MHRQTVLCVDDNVDLVDNLREILETKGFRVVAATTCAEGLEQARAGFDVALVDVRLPDGEGTTLAPKLRALAPDGQVILLTGFASVDSAAKAVSAGAWAYLVKPCATRDLLLAIDQAARHVRLLKEKHVLERRAYQAEKLAAIGTLAAGLSHEIKNPLNAATLQLLVVQSRLTRFPEENQAELAEPLQLVQDEIVRLNSLLEEFLAFARPRELYLTTFDLATLLSRVADLLVIEAELAEVRLERSWLPSLLMVADEERLQQVVLNLLRNAIQAAPRHGLVRMSAHVDADDVELVLEDDGPGVPLELRLRIFEPFFTTKASGSGLGLPLVFSIVEQHGGTVSIHDTETRGARFVVRVPLQAD